MTNLAIFASGRGSNAKSIMKEFHEDSEIQVALICSNRRTAGVLETAKEFHAPERVTT